MNNAGAIDANIVLRYLVGDIAEQYQAVRMLIRQCPGKLLVPDIAVVECVFVLSRHYQLNRTTIANMLLSFINLPATVGSVELFEIAFGYFVSHPALSFEDCCLAATARLNASLPLYTFDQKLANQTSEARLLPILAR